MSKIDIGSRLSEQTTKVNPMGDSYNEDNRKRLAKLNSEPRVKVYGNPLYKTYLGDVYTFNYQDFPVTIVFDGKYHEYPQTIAELLMEKLDAAALSHIPREMGDGDKL